MQNVASTPRRDPLHIGQRQLSRRRFPKPYPYSVGARLDLQFASAKGGDFHSLPVEIIKPFVPFTNAVALLVRPRFCADAEALGLPPRFVAKINDCRYADRSDHFEWSATLESSLRAAIPRTLREKPWITSIPAFFPEVMDEDEEDWVREIRLYSFRKECHDTEVAAYRYLRTLQGRDIPRFHGTFRFPFASSQGSSSPEYGKDIVASILDYADGMALEYIDGPNMAEVKPDIDIPRGDVERASENALQSMKCLRDLGAWHGDVRPQNVIIRLQPPHNPVIIDFGSSSLKPPDMSLEQWKGRSRPGIDQIQDLRVLLTRAGVHIESPRPMKPDAIHGYGFLNQGIERRSKEWRDRFFDPVHIDGPEYVMTDLNGRQHEWWFPRWKLKPGVKTIGDHRYN
ncbi:hypothetical protein Hypma_007266 [Hypsizygus marmoreus]|uniref:Protein kinase domain-containing protein n=1 Tax=Hypsizygus marmoreus TaxID=39966 RepID=A0A369KF21_HYPMA|nr:hypothetical protein Hypma_007266 [Hypsizygus marmoreus]